MREIKFRGWDKFENEWMDPPIIDGVNGKAMGFSPLDGTFVRCFSDSEVELMQYTGLKDKNGMEIYEGDVVTFTKPEQHFTVQGNGWSDVDVEEEFSVTGVVKFIHSMWFIENERGKGCPLDMVENQIVEVIGNIYKNPELVKEETK